MENMEAELAKYGTTGIAILVIGILFWVIKWMFVRGTKVIENLNETISQNTEYLKKRNGSLEASNEATCKTLKLVLRKIAELDKDINK